MALLLKIFISVFRLPKFFLLLLVDFIDVTLRRYPSNIALNGNFAPVKVENRVENLKVIGEIPNDLRGQYIRNGPNPQLDLRGLPYHWFDGDGMLHGVQLTNGKVNYINKWVKTRRLIEERKRGKITYGTLGCLSSPWEFAKVFIKEFNREFRKNAFNEETEPVLGMGTSNTAVEYYNHKFLALVENDKPMQVRLPDLETISTYDFDGQLKTNFTAHPKIDKRTGEMFYISYFPGPGFHYGYAKDSTILNSVYVNRDVSCMMHDMGITDTKVIFLYLPMTYDLSRALNGRPVIDWDERRKSLIGIGPRYLRSETEIKWFEVKPCYIYHIANSWDDSDDTVKLYACRSKSAGAVNFNVRTETQERYMLNDDHSSFMYEFIFNMKTGEVKERFINDELFCEFPVINRDYIGKKCRYTWAGIDESRGLKFNGIIKFDLENDTFKILRYPRNSYGGEMSFVQREGAIEEDDGYLMGFVTDESNLKTEFWIIDAKSMDSNPLARILLTERVPYGFHGRWVTEDEIQDQQ